MKSPRSIASCLGEALSVAADETVSAAGDVWLAGAFAESLFSRAEVVTVQRASDGTTYCTHLRDLSCLPRTRASCMDSLQQLPVAATDNYVGILHEGAGLEAG